MKLTNKFGYPETILKAIKNDSYTKGDSEFSATGLLTPPKIRVLRERHKDEIEIDVDDELFKLYGQIGHSLLERSGTAVNLVVERRLFGVVNGTKISAQIDSLSLEEDGTLIDWKFTTVYGFKTGTEPKREWVAQMNIQNYLLGINGLKAKRLRIYGLLRDWRPAEKKKSKGYPEKIAFHDIPMYSIESAEKFITQRIEAHRAADKELPLCDSEDNWGWNRCANYCDVSKFCDQYKKYSKQKMETKI